MSALQQVLLAVGGAGSGVSGAAFELNTVGADNSTSFTDLSASHATVTTVSGAKILSNRLSVSASTGDSLTVNNNAAFDVGSANHVWEFKFNTTQTGLYRTIISRGDSSFSAGSMTLLMNDLTSTDGRLGFWLSDFSTSAAMLLSTANYSDGVEHSGEVRRVGSTWTMKIDGSVVATQSFSGAVTAIASLLVIGNDRNFGVPNRGWTGTISGLKLTML